MARDEGAAARVSTAADIDRIVATVTSAFLDDPLWSPVFPDARRRLEQPSALWRLFVTSAQRYPWTLVTDGVESAAVWIPPGGTELTEHEERGLEAFLLELGGRSVADAVLEISERFEAARPTGGHFYLSLLGTHGSARGAGLGIGLLRESLARLDVLGAAAYLESSNPRNNQRYRDVGFEPQADLTMASGHVVTTMWRPAR